jgi:hypothetical protein
MAVRSDATEELQGDSKCIFSQQHEHSNRCTARRFPEIAVFRETRAFGFGGGSLGSMAARGRSRRLERRHEHLFHHRRRIIADYLLAAGEQVMHILGKSHVDVASLTLGAVVRNDRTMVYPAQGPQPE